MIGFLGSFCFLKCLLPAFKARSCWNRKCGLWGYKNPTYSVTEITRLPSIHLKSHWTPTHHVSTRILSCGASWMQYTWDSKEWQTHMLHVISSVNMPAPLFYWISVAKHKFKDKIIKNFKMEHLASSVGRACISWSQDCEFKPYIGCRAYLEQQQQQKHLQDGKRGALSHMWDPSECGALWPPWSGWCQWWDKVAESEGMAWPAKELVSGAPGCLSQ